MSSHVICTRWVMSENRRTFDSERPDSVENSEPAVQRPAVLDDHHQGAAVAVSHSLNKVYERHSGTPVTCHQSAGRRVAPVRYAHTHTVTSRPAIQEQFGDKLFQLDGAPSVRREQNTEVLGPWPENSPDLNPTENLWSIQTKPTNSVKVQAAIV